MLCSFDGCSKEAAAKGLCPAHRAQQKQGKTLRPLQVQYHGLTEYERFLKWTNVLGPNECWEWKGSRHQSRWHGQWRNGIGEIELAHRAAWRMMRGPIPTDMFVLHKCDNPICVNPSHLFLGSQSDNAKDMWAKRRANPKSSIGEKHGNSKLTADLVRDIRSSKEAGNVLAVRLGISNATICDIRKRRTWKHIA